MKMLQKAGTAQEKIHEATSAISCFQKALRSNIDDSACWEALGDAYMARGSYISALKTFQKAAELNPGSIYPAYQIATIKQLLGEFRQAVEAYENLLTHSPDYLPALKGLLTFRICPQEFKLGSILPLHCFVYHFQPPIPGMKVYESIHQLQLHANSVAIISFKYFIDGIL